MIAGEKERGRFCSGESRVFNRARHMAFAAIESQTNLPIPRESTGKVVIHFSLMPGRQRTATAR